MGLMPPRQPKAIFAEVLWPLIGEQITNDLLTDLLTDGLRRAGTARYRGGPQSAKVPINRDFSVLEQTGEDGG
jgi:hypothetical protein